MAEDNSTVSQFPEQFSCTYIGEFIIATGTFNPASEYVFTCTELKEKADELRTSGLRWSAEHLAEMTEQ